MVEITFQEPHNQPYIWPFELFCNSISDFFHCKWYLFLTSLFFPETQWMQHHSSNYFFLSLNSPFRQKFLKWSHQCIHQTSKKVIQLVTSCLPWWEDTAPGLSTRGFEEISCWKEIKGLGWVLAPLGCWPIGNSEQMWSSLVLLFLGQVCQVSGLNQVYYTLRNTFPSFSLSASRFSLAWSFLVLSSSEKSMFSLAKELHSENMCRAPL